MCSERLVLYFGFVPYCELNRGISYMIGDCGCVLVTPRPMKMRPKLSQSNRAAGLVVGAQVGVYPKQHGAGL